MAYQTIWYFTELPEDIVDILDKDLKVVARRTGNLPQDQVGQLLIALANQ